MFFDNWEFIFLKTCVLDKTQSLSEFWLDDVVVKRTTFLFQYQISIFLIVFCFVSWTVKSQGVILIWFSFVQFDICVMDDDICVANDISFTTQICLYIYLFVSWMKIFVSWMKVNHWYLCCEWNIIIHNTHIYTSIYIYHSRHAYIYIHIYIYIYVCMHKTLVVWVRRLCTTVVPHFRLRVFNLWKRPNYLPEKVKYSVPTSNIKSCNKFVKFVISNWMYFKNQGQVIQMKILGSVLAGIFHNP